MKTKTYIPRCIIQIKQLDLVTILLEISLYVVGLRNRAPKDGDRDRDREIER